MRRSIVLFSASAITFIFLFSISSCRKKTTTTASTPITTNSSANDTALSTSKDNNLSETTSEDLVTMVGQASESGALSSYRLGSGNSISSISCATVSVNTSTKVITVSFGGATCLDGHVRSGTLTFNYSASTNGATVYRDPGFNCHVTSLGYIVDGNAVNVNKTIKNITTLGFNPATTNLTWSVSAVITIAKSGGGGTITWNCNRTKTLLNTSDTTVYNGTSPINWAKAKISMTGSATGITAGGESYNATIMTPLIKDFSCTPDPLNPGRHPFISGQLDFTPASKATRHFDYGNLSCDQLATVTINNTTFNIILP